GLAADSSLRAPALRHVYRAPTAGAQRVFDRVLDRDLRAPSRAPIAANHAQVAQLIALGLADVGVAIESEAIAWGLGFVPLSEERFELLIPASAREHPALVRLVELIDQPLFRAEAAHLPGYDLSWA